MAVDIRTLRIGSHVLVNSVRATVERLEIRKWQDGIQRPWGFFHGIVNGTYRECGGFLDIDNVMPIPITPELLEELGFEEMYWSYEKSFVKPLQRKGFAIIQDEDGEWRTKYYPYKGCSYGEIRDTKYLHVAESFIALHGLELITD